MFNIDAMVAFVTKFLDEGTKDLTCCFHFFWLGFFPGEELGLDEIAYDGRCGD